jgi:glycosyltransferase involved in cell wall biosynthesis
MDYASLVVLTYHRPDNSRDSLESLLNNTYGLPFELIVVDDGSRDANWPMLMQTARAEEISTFVLNAGKNLGVGHGINRGFGMARGKWLVKLDADLEYMPGWLEAGAKILDTFPKVAVVGFFDYQNYNPSDDRFRKTGELRHNDELLGYTVTDFVGSAFMIRAEDYRRFGVSGLEWKYDADAKQPVITNAEGDVQWVGFPEFSDAFAEDVEWKVRMQKMGYELAILPTDLIRNHGFGLGKSTVVVATEEGPQVTKIHNKPLLFGKKRQAI